MSPELRKIYLARFTDPRSCREKAIPYLENSADQADRSFAGFLIAFCSFLLGEEEGVLEQLLKARNELEELYTTEELAIVLNGLSMVHDSYGNYDDAMELALKAERISSLMEDLELKASIENTLGNLSLRLGDLDQSIQHFEKCKGHRMADNDLSGLASAWNQLGRCYGMKGDRRMALDCYAESRKIREERKELSSLGWTYMGMATVEVKFGETENAEKFFSLSMDLASRNEDKRLLLYDLIAVSKLKRDKEEQFQCLQNALNICRELHARPQEAEVRLLLSDYYSASDQPQTALEQLRIHLEIKDELLNLESAKRIRQLQTSYAIEKAQKDAEIHRLRHVELKAAFEKVELYSQEISDSIHYAARIQSAIFPQIESIGEILGDLFIINYPRDVVSGDFYWFAKVEKEGRPHYLIILADCTGHGVPGAFMSMIGTDKLNHIVLEKKMLEPGAILSALNRGIRQSLKQDREDSISKDGMEMAVLLIDKEKNYVEYSASNRPLLVVRNQNGVWDLETIAPDKGTIGGFFVHEEPVFVQHRLQLNDGDRLYLYSDGVPDQFGGERNKKFGSKRIKEVVLGIQEMNFTEQKQHLESVIQYWKKDVEQTDDILMIGIQI